MVGISAGSLLRIKRACPHRLTDYVHFASEKHSLMTRILRLTCIVCVAIGWGVPCATTLADLVTIEFRDRNSPTAPYPDAGGPIWRGVVDTQADTLTIFHWEEIPGSTEFWVPSLLNGPLVWPAVGADGNPFDVPDTFGSLPVIDANWGFVSPLSLHQMTWVQGTTGLPVEAEYFPGWGAVRRPIPGMNPVQLTYDTTANERTMPLLPFSPYGLAAATNAQVSVLSVVSVPEPSAFLFLTTTCAIALITRGYLRRRSAT